MAIDRVSEFIELKRFCEMDKQTELLDAIIERDGNIYAAAIALQRSERSARRTIARLRKVAARQGYSPDADAKGEAPAGFVIKGKSTFYDEVGQPIRQWVKTDIDKSQQLEILKEVIGDLADGIHRVPPIAAPTLTDNALLNLYVFADYHMGMLAWHREGGDDWDLKIARQVLGGCFRAMLDQSPDAKLGFIGQLGDFLHADSMMPLTPTSGHILDVDGRFSKVVGATVDALAQLVEWALEKHQKVIFLNAEGNHDISSSIWLRALFQKLFADNPRVEVIETPLPYYAYQHGRTMLAFHHGHLRKVAKLREVMAAQFPEIWGQTKYRYCHTGHLHHVDRERQKEDSGMELYQHQTLAAKDAYAARGAYHANRGASCLTYHSNFGQVGEVMVRPEMLEQ